MGKGLIIVAIGISILISIVMLNLNANANKSTAATVNFFQNTQARIIANSGVEIYLEKMRRNKLLTGTFNNNSLMGGTYNINISGPDSALKIRCTSIFDGITHTSLVTAARIPIQIPDINGAIFVSSQNVSMDLNGNMNIDGNDHLMNGAPGGIGAAKPGIAVDDPADSSLIVNDISKHIASDITGLGGAPSVRSVPDLTDWLTITENFIYAADTVLSTGTYTTGTVLGTPTNPKITYVSGDVNFEDAVGSGIMVINGNITLSGNFVFKGIVIAYGRSTIITKTVGNSGIFGSTIFVGQNIFLETTGSSQFFYSSQAITNAKTLLKSSRFKILSWWE